MKDWKAEIVTAVLVQQRIEELDREGFWTRYLPEMGAKESQLAATERSLGFAFDLQYREFLSYADGWRSFWQAVDLFGTQELAGGPMMQIARRQLGAIEERDFEAAVYAPIARVLPVGASSLQRDMFLMPIADTNGAGSVVWYDGSVIERFPSFDEFYLAMVDYNHLDLDFFEARRMG